MRFKDASSARLGAMLFAGFLIAFGGLALAQHADRDTARDEYGRR